MRDALAERLLATVMNWSAEDVARERPQLQALASFKYDEYQQYTPGERFVERLARWLWRFSEDERLIAYRFVLTQLVFISSAEIQHFIGMAYRDRLRPLLVSETAASLGVPAWRLTLAATHPGFRERARRCLLLGLSDGARLDIFRRAAHELLTTEQFFASYEVPDKRCTSLQRKLADDLKSEPKSSALFHTIILLDDFAGSGRSFVRVEKGERDGKFVKFLADLTSDSSALSHIVDRERLSVVVLYYVASSAAISYLEEQFAELQAHYGIPLRLLAVHALSPSIVIDRDSTEEPFLAILRRYYDSTAEDRHTRSGGSDMLVGYANGGLPLVLSHNTPNNAPSLLWYEGDASAPSLFPRVTRHVDQTQGGI